MSIYLITGATGTVGSLVVQQLIERGDRPRVFVRDADKARSLYGSSVDIFTGDLSDAATLKPALTGADALLLVNAGPALAARDEAAAHGARAAGVKHLVKLSSYDATKQNVGTGVWHAHGENAIHASGIPFTFVQPSGFMSNALFWASSIKAEGTVSSNTGEGKIPFIHPRDIADVAVRALTSGEYDGVSLTITGPEALSYAGMAGKIGSAIGKTLTFVSISDEQVRRHMLDSNDPAEVVDAHISTYRAIREGRLGGVTDTVERVLGRKAITFDRWVQENVAAFVGGTPVPR